MRQSPKKSLDRRRSVASLMARRRKNSDNSGTRNDIDLTTSELNIAWNALETGDFSSAVAHAENVLHAASSGSDPAVNAQLILLKMKTRQGLFTGLFDELETLYKKNPKISSSTRAVIGNEIIRVCQRSGNFGLGTQRGEEMMSEFSQDWPDSEVVELLCQVAGCHFLRGDTDRAEEIVLKALELAERCKSPKSIAQSYWQLSSLSAGRGNMPLSLSQNQQARNWAKLAEMNRILPVLNANAASILLELPNEDFAHIHELAEAAYLELIAQNDPGSAAYACVSLSEVELRQSNYDSAHLHVDKGLSELPPEIPGPRVSLLIQKAKIFARVGDYAQSEEHAGTVAQMMKTMEPSRFLATSWGHLARVFVEIGSADRGLFAYEQALQMAGVIREESEERLETEPQRSATNQN